ncbi:MAG: hypothetical protein JWM68_4184 [Verrucomicrobiales bacterium]|nr:hypothetical protein [Verrucomicrobiales bacterium]
MNDEKSDEQIYTITEELPERNVSVMAICAGFRFLGYFDNDGKWRTKHRNEEVQGVIARSYWE